MQSIKVLTESNSQRAALKAPSSWRRGETNPPATRNPNEWLAHPSQLQPRSSSLNPLIYPTWWGDDVKEFEKAIMQKDRSTINVVN